MCFDGDSAPPIPAISGAAVSHDELVLEAADGNRFAAFSATPEEPAGAGVVILPDVRGLYRFYEELALRFAERGYPAIAIDYFGRTAGIGEAGTTTSSTCRTSSRRRPTGIQADVGAAVAQLRASGLGSIVTVGFCFGGRHSWLATAAGHGLAGAVGFYGRPGVGRDGSPGPTQRAAETRRARSSGSWAATIPASRSRRSTRSRRRWTWPESRTRSTSTRARRTASSTASRRSSPRSRRTPGTASSRFLERAAA